MKKIEINIQLLLRYTACFAASQKFSLAFILSLKQQLFGCAYSQDNGHFIFNNKETQSFQLPK